MTLVHLLISPDLKLYLLRIFIVPSFKVEVKGEDIFVTAPAADVKSSRRGVVKAKSASQSDNGVGELLDAIKLDITF